MKVKKIPPNKSNLFELIKFAPDQEDLRIAFLRAEVRKIKETVKFPHWLTDDLAVEFLQNLRTKWILGDRLPDLKPPDGWLGKLPIDCPELLGFNHQRRSTFETFLNEIGDNGRNQLAMPMEYLAQVKLVVARLRHMFGDSESPEFSMRILPEVELYYDPSYYDSSFMSCIYMVFVGSHRPTEATWKKTLKTHQHMVVSIEEVKHNIYFPCNKKLRDRIPDAYRMDKLLDPLNSGDKDILDRYNITEENLEDFCFAKYDEEEKLTKSDYWNYLFGYVDDNGPDHAVLSDNFDYSIGKPEVIRERALYKNKSDPSDIKSWFDGTAEKKGLALKMDKSSTHPGLSYPHYAISKKSLESVLAFTKMFEADPGLMGRKKEESEADVPTKKRKREEKEDDLDPGPFIKPAEEDVMCSKSLQALSILTTLKSPNCLINGAWLFGNERGIKLVLEEHWENLRSANPEQIPPFTRSALKVAPVFQPLVTVWRLKLNLSTANYHYYHYKQTPPIHPFEPEIRKETARQRKLYDCLPKISWGECFEKPEGFDPKSNELPPLLCERDLRDFKERGICLPFEIVPRPSKELKDVVDQLSQYRSDHWNPAPVDPSEYLPSREVCLVKSEDGSPLVTTVTTPVGPNKGFRLPTHTQKKRRVTTPQTRKVATTTKTIKKTTVVVKQKAKKSSVVKPEIKVPTNTLTNYFSIPK